jgi:hypothetical protein
MFLKPAHIRLERPEGTLARFRRIPQPSGIALITQKTDLSQPQTNKQPPLPRFDAAGTEFRTARPAFSNESTTFAMISKQQQLP